MVLLAVPLAAAESWVDWLLRVTGLTATSRSLRGEPYELEGDVYVANLTTTVRERYAQGGGFRSPIFYPNGESILAVRNGGLVKISGPNSEPQVLGVEVGAARLIGFQREDPDVVAVLLPDPDRLGLLRLSGGERSSGEFTPAEVSAQSLGPLWAWDVSHGETRLYHRRQSGSKFLNVFLVKPGEEIRNVTRCRDADCGQPALSADGKRVAYIKRPR